MFWLTKRTEPSAQAKCSPPGWRLRNEYTFGQSQGSVPPSMPLLGGMAQVPTALVLYRGANQLPRRARFHGGEGLCQKPHVLFREKVDAGRCCCGARSEPPAGGGVRRTRRRARAADACWHGRP